MLCAFDNISFGFGDKQILSNVSISINKGDRIGLIGSNGIGKTTFLNLLCGTLSCESGNIIRSSNLRIGYLRQNSGLEHGNTILHEMRAVFSSVLDAEARCRSIEHELALVEHDSAQFRELSREYSRLQSFIDTNDVYSIDAKIKSILNGMGFSDKDLDMEISSLSGGEKTRLAMAKLLLENPDLLVLDEPTNHLDFDTLMWLENYLNGYTGALLIVSHDRYFLDKIVNRIWEIENLNVLVYRGNYTKYKQTKKELIHAQEKEYKKQSESIAAMKDYIARNMARASTSSSAKSRVKQLENMQIIERPSDNIKTPSFKFDFSKQSGKDVLYVSDLDLKVGLNPRKCICPSINFEIKKGEKIAIVGANGTGKTTLLKSLLGLISQESGEIRWGANVTIAYYDQENNNLNSDNTIIEEFWNRFPHMIESSVRNSLGRMLIVGDNVFKKVENLSGGERAKLGFAIMQQEDANTLVFDEPTNHLDLQSREALETALSDFDGTLLFVSHDRYFLNALASKIFEINNGHFKIYNMGFDEYLKCREDSHENTIHKSETKPNQNSSYRSKKQRSDDAKKRMRISELEKQIAALEELQQSIENEINNISSDYTLLDKKCSDLEKTKKTLDEYLEEWMTLQD